MSTAVMQSVLFETIFKREQELSEQGMSSSSSVASTASSCDLSKMEWEQSPPRSASLILEEILSNSPHRKLQRTQSEPAPSSKASVNVNTSRYKTELCRPFEEYGTCKYGDKCQFAHGEGELRGLVRHPKYKTEPCRTFHTVGICPYGPRCHFIHNADEARASPPPTKPPSPSPPTSPPPSSPDARLPVFNRISAPALPLYNLHHFGELIA